jgi:hypothetical protein
VPAPGAGTRLRGVRLLELSHLRLEPLDAYGLQARQVHVLLDPAVEIVQPGLVLVLRNGWTS